MSWKRIQKMAVRATGRRSGVGAEAVERMAIEMVNRLGYKKHAKVYISRQHRDELVIIETHERTVQDSIVKDMETFFLERLSGGDLRDLGIRNEDAL